MPGHKVDIIGLSQPEENISSASPSLQKSIFEISECPEQM